LLGRIRRARFDRRARAFFVFACILRASRIDRRQQDAQDKRDLNFIHKFSLPLEIQNLNVFDAIILPIMPNQREFIKIRYAGNTVQGVFSRSPNDAEKTLFCSETVILRCLTSESLFEIFLFAPRGSSLAAHAQAVLRMTTY
jgi:hypothetical protein